MEALFETQRKKVLKMYAAAKQPFEATTIPYKSTVCVQATDSGLDSAGNGFLLIAPQTLEFFSYGINQPVPGDPSLRLANESDTNMAAARKTNGNEDYIIEGISLTARDLRIAYSALQSAAIGGSSAAVVAAAAGKAPIFDPSSILMPAQVQSPFNLEDAFPEAIVPHCSLTFTFDRRKIFKIGTLDQIPEGGRKSYLRAGGEPSTSDRYKIPEGYLWRRDGQPDCEFSATMQIQETIVFPYTKVIPGFTITAAATPVNVLLNLSMRVHGLSVRLPSQN